MRVVEVDVSDLPGLARQEILDVILVSRFIHPEDDDRIGGLVRVESSRTDDACVDPDGSETHGFGSQARRVNAVLGEEVGQPFPEHRDEPGGLRWIEVNGARAKLAIPQAQREKLTLRVPGQAQAATPSVTEEHPRRRQSVELSHCERPS